MGVTYVCVLTVEEEQAVFYLIVDWGGIRLLPSYVSRLLIWGLYFHTSWLVIEIKSGNEEVNLRYSVH